MKIFRAGHRTVVEDNFEGSLCGWDVTSPDWHVMTVDSNVDQSAGIEGGQALNCAGAYEHGGVMTKSVFLDDYAELTFEHYVQNNTPDTEPNVLILCIDNAVKLNVRGPSPWQINEPIGLSPGNHKFVFKYSVLNPSKKKGVVDSFLIREAKEIRCLITKSSPPKPSRNFAVQNILRGFTRVQQCVESDTVINFTALFEGDVFEDFMLHINDIHYYLDEFGKVYRGLFIDAVEPVSIAVGKIYSVNLSMSCPQRVGVGFV